MRALLIHAADRTRRHPYTVLAGLFLIGAGAWCLARRHGEWDEVFVEAARRLRHGGNLYAPRGGYLYPPFMAWASLPFSYLPIAASRCLWYLLSAAGLLVVVCCAWRFSGGLPLQSLGTDRREHWICALGLACALCYALNVLAHQQVDLIIAGLLLAGCAALIGRRDLLGAACFGAAAAMKGAGLLWCGYLLWRRRWLAAGWLLLLAAGLNLLPNLAGAPPGGGLWVWEWMSRYVLPMGRTDYVPGTWGSAILFNQSLSGAAQRWLVYDWSEAITRRSDVPRARPPSPLVLKWIVYSAEAMLLLAAAAALGSRPPSFKRGIQADERRFVTLPSASRIPRLALECSVVLLLMPLLSPMAGKAHFTPLLLPAFCLARHAVYQKDRLSLALLCFAIAAGNLAANLLGGAVGWLALWVGGPTWSALALLIGCLRLLAMEGMRGEE